MGIGPWEQRTLVNKARNTERARCRRYVKRELRKVEEANPNNYGASEAEQAFHRILEGIAHDGVSQSKNRKPKAIRGVAHAR